MWLSFLYLGKDGDNGDYDAEDKVEADKDLVLGAVIRLCVVHVEKNHSSNSKGVEEQGEGQQACKPAFVVTALSISYPHLVPGMGKVDEENKLDEDEDEGSHQSKVKPHSMKCSIRDEKSSHCYPNQDQKLEEPKPILNRCSWVFAAADMNHDEGEQEEEAGHSEAHPVHRLVAHKDITVSHVINPSYRSTSLTKSWNFAKLCFHSRKNHDD